MNKLTTLSFVLVSISTTAAVAQEVRYTEDGYRETRRIIRHPVTDIVHQDVPRTVYREHARTELQDVHRVYQVPVTEYRRESYWRGRWNPFVQPYLAERIIPHTRWESRAETVQLPITTRQMVAETQIDKVPVVQHRYVDEEVISRVPVTNQSGGSALTHSGPASSGTVIGGVASLDNDPPRQGASSWRPSTTVR